MGLDAYFKRIPKPLVTDGAVVDFEIDEDYRDCDTQVQYWRKNNQLQYWMARLYWEKGGEREDFNCTKLRLERSDIERLVKEMKEGTYVSKNAHGFFWGDNDYVEDDIKFFEEFLRSANFDKFVYFYYAWY